MSWKKEPCRNFMRGSCRYGDRCKFLHVTQPQVKPNPFGFGTINQQNKPEQQSNPYGFGSGNTTQQHRQQQQPNPFGFGVQSGHQVNSTYSSGNRHQQPFENKWIRSVYSSSSEPKDSQPRSASHICADPNTCKQLIVEDFTNERPLWRLTCYGHFKSLPCDIYGDVSYEELRAAAYDDARRGLSLQSIVERERNLLNSKLLEFDKLLQTPYVIRTTSTVGPFFSQSVLPVGAQNGMASQPFSFDQPRPSNIMSLSLGSVGQPGSFQHASQIANAAESRTIAAFSDSTYQHSNVLGAPGIAGNSFHVTSTSPLEAIGEAEPINASIWLKEKWVVKEIPEEEPPSRFCVNC